MVFTPVLLYTCIWENRRPGNNLGDVEGEGETAALPEPAVLGCRQPWAHPSRLGLWPHVPLWLPWSWPWVTSASPVGRFFWGEGSLKTFISTVLGKTLWLQMRKLRLWKVKSFPEVTLWQGQGSSQARLLPKSVPVFLQHLPQKLQWFNWDIESSPA